MTLEEIKAAVTNGYKPSEAIHKPSEAIHKPSEAIHKPSEAIHKVEEPKRDYLSELGFELYEKDGVWLVNDSDCEEREATLVERVLWDALLEADGKAALLEADGKAAPAAQWGALTREQIRAVFLANGFTIKEGLTDLKPYVYDAAYALLARIKTKEGKAMIKTLFRWEQDEHGDIDGTATYFPDTPHEISLRIDSFKEANALYTSIETALRQKHWDARAGLLAEIGRIKP